MCSQRRGGTRPRWTCVVRSLARQSCCQFAEEFQDPVDLPNQPVERIMVMRDVVSRSLAQRTDSVSLMTAFACAAPVRARYLQVSFVGHVATYARIGHSHGARRQPTRCAAQRAAHGSSLIVAGGTIASRCRLSPLAHFSSFCSRLISSSRRFLPWRCSCWDSAK